MGILKWIDWRWLYTQSNAEAAPIQYIPAKLESRVAIRITCKQFCMCILQEIITVCLCELIAVLCYKMLKLWKGKIFFTKLFAKNNRHIDRSKFLLTHLKKTPNPKMQKYFKIKFGGKEEVMKSFFFPPAFCTQLVASKNRVFSWNDTNQQVSYVKFRRCCSCSKKWKNFS